MRVSLDTNVLVSAVAARGLCYDIFRIVLARHQLILGEAVLEETGRVLVTTIGVTPDVARAYDALLRREAVIATGSAALGVEVRDPDDIVVLEQAVAAKADILVTGDGDLLALAPEAPLRVLTPREFWEWLREGE